jgi:hypothetical protein
MFRRLCNEICYNAKDIGQWDHNVTKDLVMLYFTTLGEYITKYYAKTYPWLERCVLNILNILERTKVKIGDDLVRWLNGLLSGWKFTSSMGSTLNLALDFAVREMYNIKKVNKIDVLGDDYIAVEKKEGDAVANWEGMTLNGFLIKPGDSTISTEGEFLRYVIGNKRVFGYPIRAIPSTIWRDTFTNLSTMEKLNEALTHYLTAVGRGCDNEFWYRITMKEIVNLAGTDGMEWATSPASLGGGGMWEWRQETTSSNFDFYEWTWEREKDERDVQFEVKLGDIAKEQLGNIPQNIIYKTIRSLITTTKRSLRRLDNRSLSKEMFSGKTKAMKNMIPTTTGDFLVQLIDETRYTKFIAWVPYFDYSISTLFGFRESLEQFANGKAPDIFGFKIEDVLKPVSINDYVRLKQKGSKNVMRKWLLQELPLSTPKFSGCNSELTSQVHNYVMNTYWRDLIGKNHIRMSNVLMYGVLAELNTFNLVRNQFTAIVNWTQ